MRVIGQFGDVDYPDRFVWLRGFRDMTDRARGLHAFYGGSVWQLHREVANSTMVDSDNVLLLRPARLNSGFAPVMSRRPPRGTRGSGNGVVIASIYSLDSPAEDGFVDYFERELQRALAANGAEILAYFVTERSANNFPRLPIREGENVFVWFASFAAARSDESVIAEMADFGQSVAAPGVIQPPQVVRLAPTRRSLVTGFSPRCLALSPAESPARAARR
jgi:hypothetical protein